MTTEITTTEQQETFSLQAFDHAQRVAKALSASTMIPKDYQNNIPNTLVALGIDKFDEIYCDAAEPKTIEELVRQGLNAKPANNNAAPEAI